MPAIRYLIGLFIAVAVMLGVCGLSIYLMDPLEKFSAHKKDLFEASRDAAAIDGIAGWPGKVTLGQHYPHNAIVIGTSKMLDIDPKDLAFFTYFNAALGSENLDDIAEYLKVHAKDKKVVVLGIDFMQFNEGYIRPMDETTRAQLQQILTQSAEVKRTLLESIRALGLGTTLAYLSSGDALLRGLRRSLVNDERCSLDKDIVFYPAGNYNKPSLLWQIEFTETNHRTIYQKEYDDQISHLRNVNYANFHYSEQRETVLRQIKDWASKNGVTLVAFLNPINERELPLIQDMGLRPAFDRFVTAVTDIFGSDAAIPLNQYADPKYFYDFDPIHFLPSTGAMIINRMVARRFGIELPKNFSVFEPLSHAKPFAGSEATEHIAAAAFDHTIASSWRPATADGMPWIGVQLASPEALEKVILVQWGPLPRRRSEVMVERSDDGVTWVAAAAHPFCVPGQRNVFYLDATVPARYWRIKPSDRISGAAPWDVAELAFHARNASSLSLLDFAKHMAAK